MVKYITFDSTSNGVIHIPLCSGLLAKYLSDTETQLYYIEGASADATADSGPVKVRVKLTTVGGTQALVDNINTAIEKAITSNWREVSHAVTVPSGQSVSSYDIVTTAL